MLLIVFAILMRPQLRAVSASPNRRPRCCSGRSRVLQTACPGKLFCILAISEKDQVLGLRSGNRPFINRILGGRRLVTQIICLKGGDIPPADRSPACFLQSLIRMPRPFVSAVSDFLYSERRTFVILLTVERATSNSSKSVECATFQDSKKVRYSADFSLFGGGLAAGQAKWQDTASCPECLSR